MSFSYKDSIINKILSCCDKVSDKAMSMLKRPTDEEAYDDLPNPIQRPKTRLFGRFFSDMLTNWEDRLEREKSLTVVILIGTRFMQNTILQREVISFFAHLREVYKSSILIMSEHATLLTSGGVYNLHQKPGYKLKLCVCNQDEVVLDGVTPLPLGVSYHKVGINTESKDQLARPSFNSMRGEFTKPTSTATETPDQVLSKILFESVTDCVDLEEEWNLIKAQEAEDLKEAVLQDKPTKKKKYTKSLNGVGVKKTKQPTDFLKTVKKNPEFIPLSPPMIFPEYNPTDSPPPLPLPPSPPVTLALSPPMIFPPMEKEEIKPEPISQPCSPLSPPMDFDYAEFERMQAEEEAENIPALRRADTIILPEEFLRELRNEEAQLRRVDTLPVVDEEGGLAEQRDIPTLQRHNAIMPQLCWGSEE